MRLIGLDIARFFAFCGMVFVNFRLAAEVQPGTGFPNFVTSALEGRAAALFVILAGIGFSLGTATGRTPWHLTLRRAGFLLAAGLLNMTIFDADILHFYALYFLVGLIFVPASGRGLLIGAAGITALAYALLFLLDYGRGWNWETLSYADFWTPAGFLRHSIFNGWHPVLPWAAFFLVGMWAGRLDLGVRRTQWALFLGGATLSVATTLLSAGLTKVDPALAEITATSPVPPTPFYILAGTGSALACIGAILLMTPWLIRSGLAGILAAPGRMSLTHYIGHILLGMGSLEALGYLNGTLSPEAIFTISLAYCAFAALFARVWFSRFKRGPLEALMRRITEGKKT